MAPLSLEHPEQFSLSWTTLPDAYQPGCPTADVVGVVSEADAATEAVLAEIAQHGNGYNLIIPEKVPGPPRIARGRTSPGRGTTSSRLGRGRGPVHDRHEPVPGAPAADRRGRLRVHSEHGHPADAGSSTKTLTPFSITVTGFGGQGRQVFTRGRATDGAWLYALQAAKTSITVFGVWLGHVYHWHIVTAAMQMTMFNTFPTTQPIYQLLAPESKFAIPFDNVLLLLWSQIAPPTSLSTFPQFLELANDYAAGRNYFDDDPLVTLAQLGITQSDFTINTPWDQYPVVQRLLTVWNLVTAYVNTFVRRNYSSDAAVAGDSALQTWIAMSSATDQGNIGGLGKVNTRTALEKVLTSLLYRITVHGISRMNATANPSLTFTPNFPIACNARTFLRRMRRSTRRRSQLPAEHGDHRRGDQLLFHLRLLAAVRAVHPAGGEQHRAVFPNGLADSRNQALVQFRNGLAAFINDYEPTTPQRFQWPRNIET